jgi:hypothetical protein
MPAPSRAISASEDARPAAILQRLDEATLDELERRLDQLLARERVADLDGWALVGIAFAEFGAGEHGGTANPVAARRRAEEHDVRADRRRARARHAVCGKQADAHRVHEAVAAVRLVEHGFAADRCDADAVAVMADARDCAVEVVIGRAEAEPVEQRDRPRAHCDDVPQDPADACCRSLKRLDGRRMVVRLHLERDGFASAEVEDARVFAGTLEHAVPVGGQSLQEGGRVLVAAVLRPEQRKDGKLEVVRLALEQLLDALELFVGQPQRTVERLFRRDLRQEPESTRGRRQAPATFPR